MNQKNKHSPVIVRFSKHKNLLDFGFKKQVKKYFKKLEIGKLNSFSSNELIAFIEIYYSYSKMSLNKFLSKFSKKLYSNPALFTIIALKIYLNVTYREIEDFIVFLDKLKKISGHKKSSTLLNTPEIL